MSLNRRQILLLLPAAAVAWDFVLAGNPEESPNYKMSEHWWGMLIDITKCIGCGSCVRACYGKRCSGGLLPDLDRALPRL